MSGSGKSLLGLWLYRSGEDWTLREASHSDVRYYINIMLIQTPDIIHIYIYIMHSVL